MLPALVLDQQAAGQVDVEPRRNASLAARRLTGELAVISTASWSAVSRAVPTATNRSASPIRKASGQRRRADR